MSDFDTDRTVKLEGRRIDLEILNWNKARKKPATVHALPMPGPFSVETPEGTMQGEKGDVLIRGVKGELYPCDKRVFNETYELVTNDE